MTHPALHKFSSNRMLRGHLFVQIAEKAFRKHISHVLYALLNQVCWKGHDAIFPRSGDRKRDAEEDVLCANISCRLFESVSVSFPRQESESVWRTFLTSLTCSLSAECLDSHNVDPVGTCYSCGRRISGSGSHLITHNEETSRIVPELTVNLWVLQKIAFYEHEQNFSWIDH